MLGFRVELTCLGRQLPADTIRTARYNIAKRDLLRIVVMAVVIDGRDLFDLCFARDRSSATDDGWTTAWLKSFFSATSLIFQDTQTPS